MESGMACEVQAGLIIRRNSQRNFRYLIFQANDAIDTGCKFGFAVFFPASHIDTTAIIEVETGRDHRDMPLVQRIDIDSFGEIDNAFKSVCRIKMVLNRDSGSGFTAAHTDCPIVILCFDRQDGRCAQQREYK